MYRFFFKLFLTLIQYLILIQYIPFYLVVILVVVFIFKVGDMIVGGEFCHNIGPRERDKV